MASNKSNDNCYTGSCPVVQKSNEKGVRSTDLPLHGNPYPPRDVIEDERPGVLAEKIGSIRMALQPYFSPICSAYDYTHDFVSIGYAHGQSGIQRLAENQSSILNATIISASGLLGVLVARRKGIFKKLLFGTAFFGTALTACYPQETREKSLMMWYITKNKLPSLVKQQFEKITSTKTPELNQSDETTLQSNEKKD